MARVCLAPIYVPRDAECLPTYVATCEPVRQKAGANQGYQNAAVLRKYGMTPADYLVMFDAQSGVCAICERACSSGKRLAVDHCHGTGKVRGLLCGRCNMSVGQLRHDPALLRKAAAYLETETSWPWRAEV